MKIHTGEKRNRPITMHGKVKPYCCDICRKTFGTKGNCGKHMLVHTQEKTHICKICGKSFCQKSDLLRHRHTRACTRDINEPCCEKTGLRGFRPGRTETGLYSHRR